MEIRQFITDTAKGAGEIVRAGFGHVKTRQSKGDRGDFVTDVDLESERYILDRIASEFPDHAVFSEEAGGIGSSDDGYLWLIDPIDGTRNFASGIPFFSISIALAKDGVARHGAVYDPLHDEMFYAGTGQGATLNGTPIQVSTEEDMTDSVISVSWVPKRADRSQFVKYVDRLSRETSYFRRLGSAALTAAYVAAGRTDAYMQAGINSWDIAAGVVLVAEAGGVVSDFEGRPIDLRNTHTDILTSSPELHRRIIEDVIRG